MRTVAGAVLSVVWLEPLGATRVSPGHPALSPAVAAKSKKRDVVQVKNPRTGHYVKIDRAQGRILDHKKSEGPYKNVPIARKRKAA